MFKNKHGPHIVLSVCWGPQLGVLTNLVFPIVERDKDFGGLPGHLPPNSHFFEANTQYPWFSPWLKHSIVSHPCKMNNEWKLDQVYSVWLIKWVVKREIIQLTELCLTRSWIISGTWWYWDSIWRYWLVFGQFKLVLLGIRWYMVSKGLVCLYILEKVEIWSGDTDASHTDSLTDNRI